MDECLLVQSPSLYSHGAIHTRSTRGFERIALRGVTEAVALPGAIEGRAVDAGAANVGFLAAGLAGCGDPWTELA